MKHKIARVVALLPICATLLVALLPPPVASAASLNFINPNGKSVTLNSDNPSQFIWKSPTQLTAFNGKSYITNAPFCDGRSGGMYVCNGNSSDDEGGFTAGYYWYWPTDDGHAITSPVEYKGDYFCPSAFVVEVTGGTGKANIYRVNLQRDGLSCKFIVDSSTRNEGNGNWSFSDSQVQGKHGNDDEVGPHNSLHYSNAFKNPSTPDEVKGITRDKSSLYAFATEFRWSDQNTIELLPGSDKFTYQDPSSIVANTIKGKLSNSDKTKQYINNRYYVADRCKQDGQVKSFIAVDPAHRSSIHILHMHKNSTGESFYDTDWWAGNGPDACMFGGNTYRNSPAVLWGGSSGDAVIGIGDVGNAAAAPGEGTAKVGGDTSGQSGDNATTTCESSGFSLSWIMCPVINGLSDTVQGIYTKVIVPLLSIKPLSTDTNNNKIYKAWGTFRVIANILLVIALLVIVFGESLGGGIVDAYTAKKALPKLLAAAILINLSYFISALLVDVFNIFGNGLLNLITAPFGESGFAIHLNGGANGGLLVAGAAGISWALISGNFLAWFWAFVLLPAVLIFIGIMATVLVRSALIMFLAIISPVAFALYALPNTEKYFRKWWDVFIETLMVFPIIAALFGIGKVAALLISSAGDNSQFFPGISDTFAGLLSVVALVIPLALVPFAFKMAGGIIGQAHEAIMGAQGKLREKSTAGMKERVKREQLNNRIQRRQNWHAGLQGQASKGGAFRRNTVGRGARMLAKGIGGYNIEAQASAARAQVSKELNDQIATGKDEEIRGLSVNKKWANKQWRTDENGNRVNDWVRDKDGVRQYKTLGGAWVNEADVDAGHSRWGNNTFAQQTALAYEMRKAQTEEQLGDLAANYHNIATGEGGWGMSDQQAGGTWIGAAFEHQNQHLEYKYTNWKDGSMVANDGSSKGAQFVDEVYEKRGSYQMGQMGSHTIKKLQDEYTAAGERGDTATQEKIAAVAETFMHQIGGVGGEAEDIAQQTAAQQATGGGVRRQASTPGAAHVAEQVRRLAAMTGRHDATRDTPAPGMPPSIPPQS